MSNYGGFHGGFNSIGPKKAKNPYNQAALDKLRSMAQEPRYANNPHYPRVFRGGMSSLAKATGEIRTVDDAIKLDKVGQFLAKIIAGAARKANGGDGDDDENGEGGAPAGAEERPRSSGSNASRNKKKKADGGSTAAGRKRKTAAAAEQPRHQLSIVPPSAVGAVAVPAAAPARKKRARKVGAASSASVSDPAKPSAKQTAYARAVREGEGLSATLDQYGDWRVILLVDRREQKADHMKAKLLMSGIDAEIRQLPIGDMLWIARGERKRITPGSGLGLGGAAEKQSVEVVLGTVVERKTLEDLTSSLFGTRFEEQRLRLKNSAAGANQVLYLVEAEKVTDLPNCSGSTLRYAMMQTQVHLGFAVVRTKGIDDTVRYLKRVHRRLMRRSFPSEFSSAEFDGVGTGRSMPTFTSPDGRVRQNDRSNGRVEMVFQNPPVPFEARRHTVYEEFKAKIELARETGTKSVKALHCAMLKQVDSWAIAKVHALADLYETPLSLARAYREALARGGLDEADAMVRDISIGKSSARARRIGPKSSSELAKVYLAGVDAEDYAEKEENFALKTGGEEGDRLESSVLPIDDVETRNVSVAPSAAATAAPSRAPAPSTKPPYRTATTSQFKKKCSYGDCSDLSSGDDDDTYERLPRSCKDDDDDDLNRKPAALSGEQLAESREEHQPSGAKKMSSVQYDYELSSDSDDAEGRGIGGGEDDDDMQRAINASLQSLAAERTNSKQSKTTPAVGKSKPKADCFDLTMDSSDDDDDVSSNDGKSTGVAKLSPINEHASGTARQPRLSHDGVGSDRNSSSGEDNEGESDSESSCDELVVRLRKKAAASGEKVRLYDSTNTSTTSSSIAGGAAGGGRKQQRLQQSSQEEHRHFFPSSASSADSPVEEQEKGNQASPPAESDSDDDIEIIELSD